MTLAGNTARKPQQNRSKASLGRMLNAARSIMLERDSDDFTLQDVSERGKVSIGSICYRFNSKDDLVRAVIVSGQEQMANDEKKLFTDVLSRSKSLADYVPRYVAVYSEHLHGYAQLLRLSMRRASIDPEISRFGNEELARAASEFTHSILKFRDEIAGDAELKINIVFRIIFATLVRQLSPDTRIEMGVNQDQQQLVRELGFMCLSYLQQNSPDGT
jgi:AcrR family transcriptional regulator